MRGEYDHTSFYTCMIILENQEVIIKTLNVYIILFQTTGFGGNSGGILAFGR